MPHSKLGCRPVSWAWHFRDWAAPRKEKNFFAAWTTESFAKPLSTVCISPVGVKLSATCQKDDGWSWELFCRDKTRKVQCNVRCDKKNYRRLGQRSWSCVYHDGFITVYRRREKASKQLHILQWFCKVRVARRWRVIWLLLHRGCIGSPKWNPSSLNSLAFIISSSYRWRPVSYFVWRALSAQWNMSSILKHIDYIGNIRLLDGHGFDLCCKQSWTEGKCHLTDSSSVFFLISLMGRIEGVEWYRIRCHLTR